MFSCFCRRRRKEEQLRRLPFFSCFQTPARAPLGLDAELVRRAAWINVRSLAFFFILHLLTVFFSSFLPTSHDPLFLLFYKKTTPVLSDVARVQPHVPGVQPHVARVLSDEPGVQVSTRFVSFFLIEVRRGALLLFFLLELILFFFPS